MILRRWRSLIGIRKSRHSRRIVPINLSQKEFALGARTGGLQDPHTEALEFGIEARRKDRIAVVNQKPARMVERQELAKLLDGPFRCGMRRNVGVQNPAGADLPSDKHVK